LLADHLWDNKSAQTADSRFGILAGVAVVLLMDVPLVVRFSVRFLRKPKFTEEDRPPLSWLPDGAPP